MCFYLDILPNNCYWNVKGTHDGNRKQCKGYLDKKVFLTVMIVINHHGD